jgi:hypothetical protein
LAKIRICAILIGSELKARICYNAGDGAFELAARNEEFFIWNRDNPLKSPDSDESNQANPSKSKGFLLGFCLIRLGRLAPYFSPVQT